MNNRTRKSQCRYGVCHTFPTDIFEQILRNSCIALGIFVQLLFFLSYHGEGNFLPEQKGQDLDSVDEKVPERNQVRQFVRVARIHDSTTQAPRHNQ